LAEAFHNLGTDNHSSAWIGLRQAFRRASSTLRVSSGKLRAKGVLLIWLATALPTSMILFRRQWAFILQALLDWRLLQSEGSYPLAMLLLAGLFLFLKRRTLADSLERDRSRWGGTLPLLTGSLLVLSSLALSSLDPGNLIYSIIPVLIYLQGLFVPVFPEASKLTITLLGLYISTSSLPTVVDTFFDQPVSHFFIQCSMPLLGILGYSAQGVGQMITFLSSTGVPRILYINSSCAGPASFSVFLFLSGLMYLDLRPDKRQTILLTSAGCVALYLLNILRLLILAYVSYSYSSQAMWEVHSYLGYVLFLSFYVAYLLVFFRFLTRGDLRTMAAGQE